MKPFYLLLILFVVLLVTQGCNTLYNTKVIDIEIVEPGKVKMPENIKTVAIRYNNCNVAPNPYFQESYYIDKTIQAEENMDSIASKLYFAYFIDELKKQNFYDSVFEIEEQDFSQIKVTDTIQYKFKEDLDSMIKKKDISEQLNVFLFSGVINEFPNKTQKYNSEIFLHPRYGLYQPIDIQNIADSTQADFLISLDYFSSIGGTFYDKKSALANEVVFVQACWNFYDLKNQEYRYIFDKRDTITWYNYIDNYTNIKDVLPPPKDAALNAADIAGVNFANYLIPHWVEVQRMYYTSGHIELKETDQLIHDGKWLEAAKIWKANVNNPNKSIAAKSKFNMALACEMQGNLKAALEWVVESFHVFGQKNEEHHANCMEYIQILGQRLQDIKIIENQVEATN